MSVQSAAVTVATTATALAAVDDDFSSIEVANVGAATVYIGGSDVTTSNGFPVAAGASWYPPQSLAGGERVYGIVASGTVEVRVLRFGVG